MQILCAIVSWQQWHSNTPEPPVSRNSQISVITSNSSELHSIPGDVWRNIHLQTSTFLHSHLQVQDGNCDEPPKREEINVEIEGHLQWQTGKDFRICREKEDFIAPAVNMTEGYCSILASYRAITLFPVKLNVKKSICIYPEEIFTPYLKLHNSLESKAPFGSWDRAFLSLSHIFKLSVRLLITWWLLAHSIIWEA